MPFIKRSQIDSVIRAPYERKYKNRLKEALRNPDLTEQQREVIKKRIAVIGKTQKH